MAALIDRNKKQQHKKHTNNNHIITDLAKEPDMKKVDVIDSIRSIDELLSYADSLGEIYQQKDDVNKAGYITLQPNMGIEKYGYSSHHLFPHTDRSNMENPPDIAILWCEKAAKHGGDSTVLDAEEYLLPLLKKANFSAIFASENSPERIEKPLYDAKNNTFRFRNDDFIFFPPSKLHTFSKLIDIIKKNQVALPIKDGQALVIDNRRMLHGRQSFIGDRIMHRVLVHRR